MNWVPILDESTCDWFNVNALGKGMNPIILSQAMVGWFYGMTTLIGLLNSKVYFASNYIALSQ